MSSRSLLLLLLVLACLQSFTKAQSANGPGQCCFSYQTREIAMRFIKGFEKTEHQCAKPGVILILNGGRQVCADPDDQWVKDIIEKLSSF